MQFPQFLWEATLSNQTSIDDKDVFAFQNDMRYKRITWLMNMARFYPPIYHLITSTSITGRHTTQRLMFSCLNSSDLILVKKRKEKKKKLNVVWSAEYICGEGAHMLTPWWRGSLARSQAAAPQRKRATGWKLYFYDTQCWRCIFTEITAGRADDYWKSPCQKHHRSLALGDAIYIDTNTSYIFRRAEKITEVLNCNHSAGYVSKHRGFVVGVNCKHPYRKLCSWWVDHFPMSYSKYCT